MVSSITDRLYGESSGVAVKAPVIAVTNGTQLPLTGLTSVGSYTPSEGDRILVKDQANPAANGIYNASASAWQRTGDFDGPFDVVQGTLIVSVLANGESLLYQLTTSDPIIGTTPLNFSPTQLQNIASVILFGADPTGQIDSSPAFAAACAVLSPAGGTVIVPPGGRFLLGSNLSVPANVTIQGPFEMVGINGPQNDYNFATMSALILSATATISLGYGAGIKGCLIYQSALSFPQLTSANFAGTAITVNGDDAFVFNSMILGFAQGISSNGFQRPRFEHLQLDNLSGIAIQNCEDTENVYDVRCWPYVTYGGGAPSTPQRSGTAFLLNNADFFRVIGCGAFGYQTGFSIAASSDVTLIGTWVDNTNNIATTSVGYSFTGAQNNVQVIDAAVSWQGTGMVVNVATPVEDNVKLIGVNIFNPQNGTCVQALNGGVVATDCNFSNGVIGIDAHTSPQGIDVQNCTFDTLSGEPHFVAGGGQELSNIWNNKYIACTTTIPEQKYVINSPPQLITNVFGTAGAYQFTDQYARGNVSVPAPVQSNDVLLNYNGQGYDGAAYRSVAGIRAQVQGAVTGSSMPTVVLLSATPTGANALVDEVGVNGAAIYPISDNALSCGMSGARWSVVYAATGTINTSDARLKTDVTPLALGLDFVNALKPVSYRWIVGGKEVVRQVYRNAAGEEVAPTAKGAKAAEILTKDKPGKRVHLGFLAQEIQGALPHGADIGLHILADPADPNSEQGLRYEQLIAPLVRAVQELTARIKVLEGMNALAGRQ